MFPKKKDKLIKGLVSPVDLFITKRYIRETNNLQRKIETYRTSISQLQSTIPTFEEESVYINILPILGYIDSVIIMMQHCEILDDIVQPVVKNKFIPPATSFVIKNGLMVISQSLQSLIFVGQDYNELLGKYESLIDENSDDKDVSYLGILATFQKFAIFSCEKTMLDTVIMLRSIDQAISFDKYSAQENMRDFILDYYNNLNSAEQHDYIMHYEVGFKTKISKQDAK